MPWQLVPFGEQGLHCSGGRDRGANDRDNMSVFHQQTDLERAEVVMLGLYLGGALALGARLGRCLCPRGWIGEVLLYLGLVAWQSATAHSWLCVFPSSAWLSLAGRESETLPPASKIPLRLALWNRKEGETPVKQRERLSALVCVSVSPLNALRGQSWVAFA